MHTIYLFIVLGLIFLQVIIKSGVINHIPITSFWLSERHTRIFHSFKFTWEINNLQVVLALVFFFKFFILVFIKSILDLLISDVISEADLVCKMHDHYVVFRLSQKLFEFPIWSDHLNAFVFTFQDVFLKTNLLCQLPDLLNVPVFSSMPIRSVL